MSRPTVVMLMDVPPRTADEHSNDSLAAGTGMGPFH
jgi:hypothetical protein